MEENCTPTVPYMYNTLLHHFSNPPSIFPQQNKNTKSTKEVRPATHNNSLNHILPLYRIKTNTLLDFLLTPQRGTSLKALNIQNFRAKQTPSLRSSRKENIKKVTGDRPFSSNRPLDTIGNKQNIETRHDDFRNSNTFKINQQKCQLSKIVLSQRFKNNYRTCFTSGINNIIGDYYIGKCLGQGAYALVKEGKHKVTGNVVAIKIYDKFRIASKEKRANVLTEIQILKTLDHPNIPKFYESIETSKHLYIIMEYVKGISLLVYSKAKINKQLPGSECLTIFKQIVSAVNYLHQHGYCHRDIKMDNIIIDRLLNAKLIDFGFGASVNDKCNVFCGTPSYMCPEIITKVPYYGKYADVWALGILLYTLHAGAYPFRGSNDKALFAKIQKGVYDIPSCIPTSAKILIKQMLVIVPENRIKCDQIERNDYFKEAFEVPNPPVDVKKRCITLYGKEIIDRLLLKYHSINEIEEQLRSPGSKIYCDYIRLLNGSI